MGLFYRNLKPKLSIFGARNRILFQKEFMHDSCIPVRGFPPVIGAKIEIIFFEGFSRHFYLPREGRVIQRAEIIPMNLIRVMPAEGKSYNTSWISL